MNKKKKKMKLKVHEVPEVSVDRLLKNMDSTDGVDWVDDVAVGMFMLRDIHMDIGAVTTLCALGLIDMGRFMQHMAELVHGEARLKEQIRSLLPVDDCDDIPDCVDWDTEEFE